MAKTVHIAWEYRVSPSNLGENRCKNMGLNVVKYGKTQYPLLSTGGILIKYTQVV